MKDDSWLLEMVHLEVHDHIRMTALFLCGSPCCLQLCLQHPPTAFSHGGTVTVWTARTQCLAFRSSETDSFPRECSTSCTISIHEKPQACF